MYLIRVSSKVKLGKGHINRCKLIRNNFDKETIWFVDKGTKKVLFQQFEDKVVEEKSSYSINNMIRSIKSSKVKAVIIDSPSISLNIVRKLSKLVPTVIIMDEVKKINNVLTICLHPFKKTENNILSGITYMPISKKKITKKLTSGHQNILISLGSIDSKNITKKIIIILNEIMESKKIENFNIKIHVVIGSLSKNISSLKKLIERNKNYKLYTNLSNLNELYKISDFAIGAPGFSQIERLAYNIPTILVSQNKSHDILLKYWKRTGCAVTVNNIEKNLKSKIIKMVTSNDLRKKVNRKILATFDSNGSKRIFYKINAFIKNHKPQKV